MARARAPSARVPVLAVRAALAFDAAGQADSAAAAFAAARAGSKLASIDSWLRVRQARVTRDTAAAAQLLTDLPPPAVREVPVARARSLLLAGDTTRAIDAFAAAGKGGALDATRLALATGDSARARTLLYALLARDPLSDEAAAGVSLAIGPLPPRDAAEHVALARALNRRTTTRDARIHVEHALRSGDSSATTPLPAGGSRGEYGPPRQRRRAVSIGNRCIRTATHRGAVLARPDGRGTRGQDEGARDLARARARRLARLLRHARAPRDGPAAPRVRA